MFFLVFFFLLCNGEKCNINNCKIPLCKCPDTQIPGDLAFNQVPMMIVLTFNGILLDEHLTYLKKILNPIYRNPNRCPIQATFFISDHLANLHTDYCQVQNLFNNNNEIAVGTSKYTCHYTDCNSLGMYFSKWNVDKADKDIFEQKRTISQKAKIHRSFLRGFRVPLMDNQGNSHYKALTKYAFNYDSSVIISPDDIQKINGLRYWPHTVHFEPNYTCDHCPTRRTFCGNNINCTFSSLWILPQHYLYLQEKNPCPSLIGIESYMDRLSTTNCFNLNQELTDKILTDILNYNFKRHYETNKAPYVLNIELSWFKLYGDMLTKALMTFIHDITNNESYKDVYFVQAEKVIEWIQYPTPLHIIANKWLWECDGIEFDYDRKCNFDSEFVEKNAESLKELKNSNKTNTKLDLRGEDLYRNGVLTVVCVVFTLGILFVFLYDRFH